MYAVAERLYRKALAKKPAADMRRKLTEVLLWQKKYDEAIPMLRAAADAAPDDESAAELLADAYVWSGQREQGIELYRKLLAADTGRREVAVKLADALRHAGRDAEAEEVYKQYLVDR